ncbi:ATP-grasp domain-containing protein [Yinghuangia sp. YIM S10712]|uniref:ATP-grasp domain-containing protein n=1 Tax=Yinghuangia sp. YIM S10712 TaxID=3436930 RepID=UPI003F53C0CA
MPVTRRVAVATSAFGLTKDTEIPLVVDALRQRGVDAVAVAWDDGDFAWSSCAAVVIRSTWRYEEHVEQFIDWVESVGAVTRLDNPPEVVRWNMRKTYLGDLADRGVPVVPTRFFAPGEKPVFPEAGQYVVKPTVSAGARNTARYAEEHRDTAARHVAALHARGATVMVQPYVTRIAEGERALVFFGGEFSHAIRKQPVLTDIGVVDNARVAHPGILPHDPNSDELELAAKALAAAPTEDPLLYARVDVALADDGSPMVMELELIEPNLFLTGTSGAMDRFTGLVHDRLK